MDHLPVGHRRPAVQSLAVQRQHANACDQNPPVLRRPPNYHAHARRDGAPGRQVPSSKPFSYFTKSPQDGWSNPGATVALPARDRRAITMKWRLVVAIGQGTASASARATDRPPRWSNTVTPAGSTHDRARDLQTRRARQRVVRGTLGKGLRALVGGRAPSFPMPGVALEARRGLVLGSQRSVLAKRSGRRQADLERGLELIADLSRLLPPANPVT